MNCRLLALVCLCLGNSSSLYTYVTLNSTISIASTCQGGSVFDFVTQSAAAADNATTTAAPAAAKPVANRDITVGPCKWAIGRSCPDPDVKYYIYTRRNVMDRQSLHIDATAEQSNLTNSYFNPKFPTKILIHGYNSDMFLSPLQQMRDGESIK